MAKIADVLPKRRRSSKHSIVEIPGVLPPKDELERQHLFLDNEKLKAETDKLKQDAKPTRWWLQVINTATALGGVAAVFTAIFGIWASYNSARMSDQRTAIDEAIKQLDAPTTISQLAGVSILSGYLGKDSSDVHGQVLLALASVIATTKDVQTSAAVLDLVDSLPDDGSVSWNDWGAFQNWLVSEDLGVIKKYKAATPVASASAATTPPCGGSSDYAGILHNIGFLIAINARHGRVPQYPNYREICCQGCDFSGAKFPRGADFTEASLNGAIFAGASLEKAIFSGAGLAGASFVEADLTGADLRRMRGRVGYLDDIAKSFGASGTTKFVMPNFSCSILDDADFGHQTLFPGVMDLAAGTKLPDAVPPRFFNASIKSTHLDQTEFFGFSAQNHSKYYVSSAKPIELNDKYFWQDELTSVAFEKDSQNASDTNLSIFQGSLRASFYSALNLDEAQLSDNVANFLKLSKPNKKDAVAAFGGDGSVDCKPRSSQVSAP